jgi:hypothetical protein
MSERSSLASLVLAATFALGRPVCSKKAAPPDAGPAASSGPIFVTMPPLDAPDAAPPASPDAGPPPASTTNAAAIERSHQWLEDLRWFVAHNATVNPEKAGEGDAASKCDDVQAAREALGQDAHPDPSYKQNLDGAAELCAFDVPLINAREALDRLRFSPSQASRLLQCNVARREIDKARAVHPRDARVRQLDARRGGVCH